MSLLEPREGSNQLVVLSYIAELNNERVSPRQKEIVERSSLSKGAVSNNCKKLMEEGVVSEEGSTYEVDFEDLMDKYRDHLENYLVRERKLEGFEEEVLKFNKIRTKTKMEMEEIFNGRTGNIIEKLLNKRIIDSRRNELTNTLKEVFLKLDMDLQLLGEAVKDGEDEVSESLRKISASIARVYQPISTVYPELKPETTVTRIAESLEE